MGQRLAHGLAIAFKSKVEASAMDLRPLIYLSYYSIRWSTGEFSFMLCGRSLNYEVKSRKMQAIQSLVHFVCRRKAKNDWLAFFNVSMAYSVQ
ncbi:hypothetical protein KIN20_030336 [Parelaphostrongylus tenuis]|uniref:Uncharacterized protein n=1 Tax=Parelaphostrongylus tenuis TaxID=148309 RepID=A0AAD5R3L1_PARTN|nr:hypothetical protein KIN20_030336 [Parelaphostrongylus tenuis]